MPAFETLVKPLIDRPGKPTAPETEGVVGDIQLGEQQLRCGRGWHRQGAEQMRSGNPCLVVERMTRVFLHPASEA